MDQVSFLVVGCGRMGLRYARLLHEHPCASIAALVGNSEERVKQVRAEFPDVPVVAGGLRRDILERFSEIDAVVIATPEWAHEPAAILALEYGKHLLIEKPISDDFGSAQRIFDAVKSSNKIAMPCHTVRFDARAVSARELLHQSGNSRTVRRIYGRRNADREAFARLSGRTDPVFWLLPHDLDLLVYLTGSAISEVSGREIKVQDGKTGGIVCDVKLANGADATLETMWLTPPLSQLSKTVFMDILTDDGAIELDLHRGGVTAFSSSETVSSSDPAYTLQTNRFLTGADAGLIDHFIRVVLGLCEPLCTIKDGLDAVKAASAVRASIDGCSEMKQITKSR